MKKSLKKFKNLVPFLLLPMATVLIWAAPLMRAQNAAGDIEFDEAEVFFEFNSTDLDLGFQLFLDGPGWRNVTVTGPDKTVFTVENGGGLTEIGSTEVFTESAEPELDEANLEQAMADFVALFPEGEYTFEGTTVAGENLSGTAELTHDLPLPVFLFVEDFPEVEWLPDESGPAIVGYEMVVEIVVEVVDDERMEDEAAAEQPEDEVEERVFVNTATLPASQTSFTVSEEFADLIADYLDDDALLELKVELIAEEESGNKTITEEVLVMTEEDLFRFDEDDDEEDGDEEGDGERDEGAAEED